MLCKSGAINGVWPEALAGAFERMGYRARLIHYAKREHDGGPKRPTWNQWLRRDRGDYRGRMLAVCMGTGRGGFHWVALDDSTVADSGYWIGRKPVPFADACAVGWNRFAARKRIHSIVIVEPAQARSNGIIETFPSSGVEVESTGGTARGGFMPPLWTKARTGF